MMACRCRQISVAVLLSGLVALVAIVLQQPDTSGIADLGKTSQEIIASRGFESETHFIQSADGYILQVVRIINPTVKNRAQLKPVLLHHGFQCSSSLWLVAADGRLQSDGRYTEDEVNQKDTDAVGNSLGFVLASRGYDVWLANYRGNIYSRNHTTLKPEEDAFWRYSVDEMITYDLPAQIDYIRAQTKRKTISYIGHSQGNYMMLGLLANQPQYSAVIKPHIALSPVSFFTRFEASTHYLKHFRSTLLRLFPRDFGTNHLRKARIPQLCANPLLQKNLCYLAYWFLLGSPRSQINWDRMPVYWDNFMTGSSTRNYIHLLQQDSVPMRYSYEDEEPGRNVREYQQPFPSIYPYERINSTDIALIYVKRDWFNHIADVHLLKEHLNVPLLDDYQVPDEEWNHMDLIWGKDVGRLVNRRVLQLLAKY